MQIRIKALPPIFKLRDNPRNRDRVDVVDEKMYGRLVAVVEEDVDAILDGGEEVVLSN